MFKTIAIAGTFDRLHKGHRFFISQAFKSGEKVIIGLTSDDYVKEKITPVRHPRGVRMHSPGVEELVKPKIQTYKERKKELRDYLKERGLLDRAEIVKIDDVYGPAGRRAGRQEDEIEALVVTNETMHGGKMVNQKRREKGLKQLKLLRVSLIPADDRKRIASTRIRLGEIDRWGRVYAKVHSSQFTVHSKRGERYKISEELRQELKKPQGVLVKGNPENHKELASELKKIIDKLQPTMIATVGDEVTRLCNQVGIEPDLAIIDYCVMRQRKYNSLGDLGFPSKKAIKTPGRWPQDSSRGFILRDSFQVKESVKNPPGNITQTLIMAVKKSIKTYLSTGRQQIIKVLGEEDLAGLPAILLSPLGAVVIYGQPNEGLVVVEITEKKKQQLLERLS